MQIMPPSHPLQPMTGALHIYDPSKRLVAFESGNLSASNVLVFIGGLGDGLCAIPVLPRLSAALETISPSWSLIQILTKSSYNGWWSGSIDNDAEDLHKLEDYLRNKKGKDGKFVLLGHSTGANGSFSFRL